MNTNRLQIMDLLNKLPGQLNPSQTSANAKRTSEIFGTYTFTLREMERRLSPEYFSAFKKVSQEGLALEPKVASAVADAARTWALSLGASHFTHWFQPMTGLTAEKHDSFISFDTDGSVIEKFSGGQLMQSEPDASSFPSGGMRSTFEARGYTAWDTSSPMFVVEHAGVKVLCVPSVFVSYTGHSLDTKTSLIRSIDALSEAAVSLLHEMNDTKVNKVIATLGCEQEYFLVDKRFLSARPDLLLTGRTLLGADMPKGQQLEDHYFGAIPTRVQTFMADAETELYKLGIPVKTRHNEVAPAQFEMAPIFEDANLAADHNMLTMEVLKRVAEAHGFVCLMHEKPFAGVNGSGKHCNWAMATETGENLLEPGNTPHLNFRFIAILSCVLKAVCDSQIALRGAIASHGNDHRLGANEAPPAIISAFMGSTLTQILDGIIAGSDVSHVSAEKAMIEFKLNRLPSIPRDNTDRNRTSPFAFTGNKFEFRAVGSSQAVSFPVTVLNAAVAQTLRAFVVKLKAKKAGAASIDSAVLAVAKEFLTESKKIRFEGDGYSAEWRAEAGRRGLSELLKTPESLAAFAKKENHQFLIDSGTYGAEELHALMEIRVERYIKFMDIEAQTLLMLARQYVIPAALSYQRILSKAISGAVALGLAPKGQKSLFSEILSLVEGCYEGVEKLQAATKDAHSLKSPSDISAAFGDKVTGAMALLRDYCDKLEAVVGDEYWPLPKYREMLFIR